MATEDRWHDFAKEKPSEDMEGRNFIVSNGYSDTLSMWCGGYWENEPFMGSKLCDEVVRWKGYLTPEEEKANEATRTELKAYNVVATADVNPEVVDSLGCTEWAGYNKDEADNVIAEKDEEIAELKMQVNGFKNRANLWAYNAQNEHNAAVEAHLENAKLKKELENVRNSYKDSVEIKVKIWERCKKAEADAAETLALLEERNKQVGELKHSLELASNECCSISERARMRERRLRRALWHAIALFCARSCEYFNGIMSHCLMGQDDLYKRCEEKKNKYIHAMYKCRAKEKEYK